MPQRNETSKDVLRHKYEIATSVSGRTRNDGFGDNPDHPANPENPDSDKEEAC